MKYPPLLFMRHGETEWNVIGRTQGVLNSALTAKGRGQAELLGRILKREIGTANGYHQFVSPLGRTLETAAGIKKHFDFSPKTDERLQEVNVGKAAGMTKFEIEMEFPEHMQGKKRLDWYFGAPDGETLQDLKVRASDWLNSLSGPTIAVSHGQIGKVIRGLHLGLTDNQLLDLTEPQGVVHVLKDRQETLLKANFEQA